MADQELIVKFKGDLNEWDAAVAKAKSDLALLDSYFRKAAQAQNISTRATSMDTAATTQLVAAMNILGRKLSENSNLVKENSAQLNTNASSLNQNTNALKNFKPVTESATASLGGFLKGYLSITALIQGGKMFLDATAQMQKYEGQLKAASGTQENLAKSTAFLEGLADKYNKNVIDLGASYAQLTIATKGTNLEGEKADRLFAAVTATSSALQMSVDETNGTFQAFIQMVSKGSVQAEELRGQLGERLYGAFNLAAKAMGVSTAELNKMLEQGQVLAEDLLPKMTIELEKTFGKDAQENASNLGANIEYATGQLTLFFAEAGKSSGFTGFLTQAADDAGSLLSQLRLLNKEKGLFAAAGGGAGAFLETLTGGLYTSPALEYARMAQTKQQMSGYSLFEGEFKTNSKNFPFVSDKTAPAGQTPEQIEKAKKAAEKAAKEAARQLDAWTAEQIRLIKDETARQLLDAEIANNAKYRTHNSPIDTPGQRLPGGTKNTYSLNGGQMRKAGEVFTNESTGDGSAINYDHIIANMSTAVDAAIAEQARLQKATQEFEESFDQSMKNALGNALANTAEGVGELIAGLATGTSDLEDVGNTFAAIIATLLRQIADALVAYAAVKILANEAFKSGNPYVALAAAALAYGAAAVAESAINNAGSDAAGYWTGGIVDGPGGRDRVPIMATRGEIMMNGSQQNRLWNFLSGGAAPDSISGASGGSAAHGSDLTVTVRGRLKGGDIDLAGQQGNRNNNYFRSKRG